MIRPPRLQPGGTIGIVSPSWGGAGAFPHRLEQGIRQIEALGFGVKIGAHALNQHGHVSDSAQNRAADLHAFFADPQVSVILSSIGGDHSCHLLPLLDLDLIRSHPKILIGFSDITVLNVALHAALGLVTFNGPALLTDFAERPQMYAYTRRILLDVVTRAEPAGQITPASEWTEEFQDWEKKLDLHRPRQMQPSSGWSWLKAGFAEGPLLGGCIESLNHLRGTRFWPNWSGAIFFWETSEEKPPSEKIDGLLMDYENMGVLDQISGMLVGRPMRYSDEEKQALREVILERTSRYNFPVLTDMDFGHTAPQMTLPLGIRAQIDSARQQFALLEAAVQ